MKHEEFFEPQSGKLVHQFLDDVTFAYYFYLAYSIDCWVVFAKDNNSEKGLHHAFGYGLPTIWP